ncbi:hypothetical protein PIB30_023709 [Stylosanthes scabra]|uniref:Uncharacterized protein n=1 Tax=Stylosanthes scabra TaxID=79078 RepID=A0ABU6U9W4_9FABA|nr:hypothetical protein [Stylosanthes scabra]
MREQKGLVIEGLALGPSTAKSSVEQNRSDGISSKDESKHVQGRILEDIDGLRQVKGGSTVAGDEHNEGCSNKSRENFIDSLRGLCVEEKVGKCGCRGKTTNATMKGMPGKRRKKLSPSILDLSVLDETLNSEVESKRVEENLCSEDHSKT